MSTLAFVKRSSPPIVLPCPEEGRSGIARKNRDDFPEWPGSYFELGLIAFNDHTKTGEKRYLDEAKNYFDQAILKGNEQFPEFYLARSATNFLLKDNAAAENDLKKAQQIDENDYAVLCALAFFYEEIDKMDEAEKIHRKIVANFPDNVEAHVNYAWFSLGRNNCVALKHYTEAATLAPNDIERLMDKGVLARKMEKFGDAEEALFLAMELYKKEPNPDADRKRKMYEQLELARARQS